MSANEICLDEWTSKMVQYCCSTVIPRWVADGHCSYRSLHLSLCSSICQCYLRLMSAFFSLSLSLFYWFWHISDRTLTRHKTTFEALYTAWEWVSDMKSQHTCIVLLYSNTRIRACAPTCPHNKHERWWPGQRRQNDLLSIVSTDQSDMKVASGYL